MEDGVLLDVKTEDSGRLIGRQGQTLSDLQYITNRLLFQQDPSAPKIMVDVSATALRLAKPSSRKRRKPPKKSVAGRRRRIGTVDRLRPPNHSPGPQGRSAHRTHSVEVEGTDKKPFSSGLNIRTSRLVRWPLTLTLGRGMIHQSTTYGFGSPSSELRQPKHSGRRQPTPKPSDKRQSQESAPASWSAVVRYRFIYEP